MSEHRSALQLERACSLRLVTSETIEALADSQDDSPSLNWPLSRIFLDAFLPLYLIPKGLACGTFRGYWTAVAWWCRLNGGTGTASPKLSELHREDFADRYVLSGDPPLGKIDSFTLARFETELARQPGRKTERLDLLTVRNQITCLQHLLSFAGPKQPTREGARYLGLIEPLYFTCPRPDVEAPSGDFSLAEIKALLLACSDFKKIRSVPVKARDWWRAFIVVSVCTGLRLSQLMSLAYRDRQGPRITVWAKDSKGRRGKLVYLPPVALEWIERIRTPREKIFAFANWPNSKKTHHDQFKRLAKWAGISQERSFGFNGLRKANASLLAGLDADDPSREVGVAVVQRSLGHTTPRTAMQHYISGSVIERLLMERADRLGTIIETLLVDLPERQRQKRMF